MMIVRWSSSAALVIILSLTQFAGASTFSESPSIPTATQPEPAPPSPTPPLGLEDLASLSTNSIELTTTVEALPLPTVSLNESDSAPIAEEVTTDSSLPNPPAFLSFNEWREKYAALPEASGKAGVKKGKKSIKKVDGITTTVEGDGTENGSLFSQEMLDSVPYEPMVEGWSREGVVAEKQNLEPISTQISATELEDDPTSRYPLQPLPFAGSGESSDPLLLLKDRTNYALADCAAKVHRASPQSKGASSILVEKKDRYMLTPCAASLKFVELELCDEIRIDTIVLANFEFFSSMFRHFSIKVSMHYPGRPDEWQDLGTFRARNVRGVQVFNTNHISGWHRYMRIDFLSHYGSEYYCPVSLLRVYGITQMDKFRQEQEEEENANIAANKLELTLEEEEEEEIKSDSEIISEEDSAITSPDSTTESILATEPAETITTETKTDSSASIDSVTESPTTIEPSVTESLPPTSATTTSTEVSDEPKPSVAPVPEVAIVESPVKSPSEDKLPPVPSEEQEPPKKVEEDKIEIEEVKEVVESESVSSTSQTTSVVESATSVTSSASPTQSSSTSVPSPVKVEDLPTPSPIRARNDTRSTVPPPTPQSPQAGDSIYGTIMKRLSGLEHNQTLSMHYIEAQSAMVREAFVSIERRLLDYETLRTKQDSAINTALLDLQRYRIEMDRDRMDLNGKFNLLTNEMMLERRLSLLGLLALFIFIFFSRGLPNALFPHVPMLQSTSGPRVMTTILADSPERRRKELVKVEQHDRKLPVVDSTTVNPVRTRFGSTPLAAKIPRRRNSAGPKIRRPGRSSPSNQNRLLPFSDDPFRSNHDRSPSRAVSVSMKGRPENRREAENVLNDPRFPIDIFGIPSAPHSSLEALDLSPPLQAKEL